MSKISKIIFLIIFQNFANASCLASSASSKHNETLINESFIVDLPIVETFIGNRRTNIAFHPTLYPEANLAQAVNCHPYNPTEVSGSNAPACPSHPLVVKYDPALCRDFLPEKILGKLDAAGVNCQLFLNVQDNPWNGTLIQLRAHAFSDFFPSMGGNYQGVNVVVCRSDATQLLSASSSVHLHDGIASPSNFAISGLDHKRIEDFYSIVTFGGRTIITRHILLTVAIREVFQTVFCAPAAQGTDRSPRFFTPLFKIDYSSFLQKNGII